MPFRNTKAMTVAQVWAWVRGPIPKGMFLCHHCDVPCCVNPNHLFLGTPKDNTLDAVRKGRHASMPKAKTHCVNGHEYTPENTRIKTWWRRPNTVAKGCRICERITKQAHLRRKAERAAKKLEAA